MDWSASEKDKNAEIYQKFFIRIILNKINSVFEAFNNDNKIKSRFKEISSQSVQSMMIALSNAVIYGFKGDEFNIEKNKERLSLITKCAIDSDATIGFNLPLIDDKKPENGNYFVAIMNQLKNSDINSKEVENAVKLMSDKEVELIAKFAEEEGGMKKTGDSDSEMRSDISKFYGPSLMKEFRQNMAKLVDMIVKYAKKIKETAEKKRQNEAQKAQQQSEANEKNKK